MKRTHRKLIGGLLASIVIGMPAAAQSQSMRASITGGDGSGKCTFEVQVDGADKVEIDGDRGTIRQLSANRRDGCG